MLYQKKKFFGILFFALLVSATFLVKNIVGATVDSIGNSITGTNINIANVANYNVTMQFSGTLDSGDIVVVELIDTSLNTISNTYISTGNNETDITINFVNAATLNEGTITLSGSIFDSGLNLISGEITTTILLDTILPTFNGVTSGTQYSGDVAITFDDTNISGATLSGTDYTSGDTISAEGSYEFIVTDIVGNSTGATFVIDKSEPTFDGVISGTYYSGDVTITFSDTATINGLPISSGDTISAEEIYTLIVTDGASNQTGATFTIDKTPPAISNITSGDYFSGNITPAIIETNFSGATLDGAEYIPTTEITGEATYELIITDLANNITTITFTIDTTLPTAYVEYAPTSGSWTSGNVVAIITGFSESIVNQNTGVNIFVNNGSFTFTFEDLAGNPGSSTAMVDWIDNVAPTVSTGYISVGNTGNDGTTLYYKDTITIQADVSDTGGSELDTGSCEYTLDGSSRIAADYTTGYCYKSGLSPADDITIAFRMQDSVGNITTGNIETYVYDNTIPTATDDANSTTGRVDVTVIITAIDTGVGISGTLYCIDTAGSCTPNILGASVSVTGATNAITHKYVRYYSIDKLNNTGTIQTSAQINIDKETPVLTGTSTFSSNNITNTGYAKVGDTITVFFQSHEALTGTPTMTISGGSLTTGTVTNIGGNNYSGSYVMKSTDTEGTIGFNIFMTDLVGNTGTIFTGSTIIFDRTAPAGISITAPTTTTYLKGDPDVYTILWNVGTDNNWSPTPILLEYSLTNFISTTNITTGTINDGSHTFIFPNTLNTFAKIRIIATDLAGNIAYFTGNEFSIDNTPPTDITITYPGLYLKGNSGYQIDRSGGIDANPQTIILAYTTNGTTFNTICTRTNNEQNCSRTTPNLNSSTVQLRTVATDEVGMNKQRTTPTFIVDSTPPTAIVFTDNDSSRRNTDAIATGTSTDALAGLRSTGMVYRTDTAFTGTCNGGTTTPPTFTGEGYRTGYACISDNAGNIRTGQQSYQIDKTLPTLQTGSDITVNTATTINITGTDALAGISGYIRSQTSGPGTISFTTNTSEDPTVSADSDGDYVLQILLIDNANNSTTGTIHFTRDTVNPTLNGAASVLNTTSQTPNYSFTGDEAGTISYSGSCSSATTTAISGLNTITFTALANATYSTCQLRVTDTAGNSSSRLTIPTFTVNYSAPSGGGGGGGGGGSVGICTDSQLMCVSGIYAMKAGVNCQGGNLGNVCGSDICVDGDYSGDPDDGICYDPTKVEAGTGNTASGTVITSTGSRTPYISPYNEELTDAYSYAYGVKITTVPDIKRANLTGVLIRSHLSKMMSQYATKVLGKKPDTTRNCVFKDMNGQTEEFKTFAIMACQLGLMGLKTDGSPATIFNPNDEVSRAIFGTTLSRALFGDTNNGGQNRYAKHLDALKEKAVMNYIDKPFNLELRGYVMLMMMRADQKFIKSSYSNFTSLRGSKTFVPGRTITVTPGSSQFTETELDFIENLNKEYQFIAGYTVGESDLGVKYLQYLLKAKGYYVGTINGINTNDTVTALYEFQFDNNIVDKATDQGAGYLGPSTRELLNPLLQTLLNP